MLNRSFLRSRNGGRKLCTGAAALLLSQPSLAQYRFEFLDQFHRAGVAGRVTDSERIPGIPMPYEDTSRVLPWQGGQFKLGAAAGLPGTHRDYRPATLTQSGKIDGRVSTERFIGCANAGQVVGASEDTHGRRGARTKPWPNGTAIAPGTPGGAGGHASAINEPGAIATYSSDDPGNSRATHPVGRRLITGLDTFLSAQLKAAGWARTYANDVNDKGWIVGNAYDTLTEQTRFLRLSSSFPEPSTYPVLSAGRALTIPAAGRGLNPEQRLATTV